MSDATTTTGPIDAAELTTRLGGRCDSNSGGRACCPAHNGDNARTLSIQAGKGGKILLHCYKGCKFAAIIAAIKEQHGLVWKPDRVGALDVTPQEPEWQPIFPPPLHAVVNFEQFDLPSWRYDVLHRYTDLDGNVTHYVRRLEAEDNDDGTEIPKRMFPVTYGNFNGEVGWHSKALRAPLPLYGLERLKHAGVAIICEGEKAADAAHERLGTSGDYACLAISGGAKRAKDADLSPLLQADLLVIVWPDADATGQEAVRVLLQRLPDALLVDTTGLGDGHDAADEEFYNDPGNPFDWLEAHAHPLPRIDEVLSASAWLQAKIAKPTPLLGELITSATRAFIVGKTGLGKTLLGLAWATAMASHRDFLDWHVQKRCRVLYIDGEMAPSTTKQRIMDEVARQPGANDHLMIWCRMHEPALLAKLPGLSPMPPLNTPEGCTWVCRLLDRLEREAGEKYDAVYFDNIMSLTSGVQRDEESFTALLPLVEELSLRGIAQIWLDHTGIAGERQYGTATKQWRFDTVGMMTPVAGDNDGDDDEPARGLRPFLLSFELPHGKSRTRTPENWYDFTPRIIGLRDGKWFYREPPGKDQKKVEPADQQYYKVLCEIVPDGHDHADRQAWLEQCIYRGLIEKAPDGKESWQAKGRRTAAFRKALLTLQRARRIVVAGDSIQLLRRKL